MPREWQYLLGACGRGQLDPNARQPIGAPRREHSRAVASRLPAPGSVMSAQDARGEESAKPKGRRRGVGLDVASDYMGYAQPPREGLVGGTA